MTLVISGPDMTPRAQEAAINLYLETLKVLGTMTELTITGSIIPEGDKPRKYEIIVRDLGEV